MKLSYLAITAAIILGSKYDCDGFSLVHSTISTPTTTQLDAIMDRRKILSTVVASSVALSTTLGTTFPAYAAEYEPRLKDMQQIYFLGASLDKLTAKLEDPNQIEVALSGVKDFNREPDFYNTYAQNFIKKSVKYNSSADPRVGYIKQASTLIGSLENLLQGTDAMMNEKTVKAESIKRVQKAQSLISKFLAESGVQDEKLAAFISSHK